MDIGSILSSLSAEDMQKLQSVAQSLGSLSNSTSGEFHRPNQNDTTNTPLGSLTNNGTSEFSRPNQNGGTGTSFGLPSNGTSDILSAFSNIGTAENKSSVGAGFNLQSLSEIASLISKFDNAGNDPRCKLILALKPMLSTEKQKRADEAVKIIKLLDILPVLRESGLLKGAFGL